MRPGVRLAFDVGKVRIGVARCDAEAILSVPVTTLKRNRFGADLEEAAELIEEYDAMEAVVGLPPAAGHASWRGSSHRRACVWWTSGCPR